jgi:hypothetical protein
MCPRSQSYYQASTHQNKESIYLPTYPETNNLSHLIIIHIPSRRSIVNCGLGLTFGLGIGARESPLFSTRRKDRIPYENINKQLLLLTTSGFRPFPLHLQRLSESYLPPLSLSLSLLNDNNHVFISISVCHSLLISRYTHTSAWI